MTVKLLTFAGSARRDSYNKKIIRWVAEGARTAGAEVTEIDLADFPLPLFDEDLEKETGEPAAARQLKDLFFQHHGFAIACPEYNSSITPLLKNTIDWLTRLVPPETPLQAFRGKTAALVGSSPGALGGLRGLVHVRAILGNIGVHVLPDQWAVPKVHELWKADGSVADSPYPGHLRGLGQQWAQVTAALNQRT